MEEYKNFVNGAWVGGSERLININPSDIQNPLGTALLADDACIARAVAGAQAGQRAWAACGIEARSDVLMRIGNELIEKKQEIGTLISLEEGKPLAEGVGEVDCAGRFFQYFAAEALRNLGNFADSVRAGVEIEVLREPVGTVLIITPWNFPVALPAWKIAPALAFGNSVVFKPAPTTPASACALAAIIERAGLPEGAFQMVLGDAKAGQALLRNEAINAVSFTGSLPTGRIVAQESSAFLRPFQLEMGSKNALLVLDDADMDVALACAVNGAFGGTGQKCTASSRIIVTAGVYDAFLEKFAEASSRLKIGHALEAGINLGPCASEAQLANNNKYMNIARDEGATLFYQGELPKVEKEGYYFSPVIFTNTNNAMRINREEIFGPITCVMKVRDYAEGLEICNDTDYGLTAGIVTRSLQHATHFKRNARSGCVMVNLPTAGTDYHVPFGGTKNSSFGPREQGTYAIEFYTKVKTAYIRS